MNQKATQPLAPMNTATRILALDALRGFAVLGILIINIQNFSMPGAAYLNPTAYGNLTDVNQLLWILAHLIASEKFLSIFAIVFGAGIILFSEKVKITKTKSAPMHYRRMLWLLLFGLMHAYLLWSGDILVAFSLCGMLAFLFRKKKPKTLIWLAFTFYIIPLLIYTAIYFALPYLPQDAYQQIHNAWKPDPDMIRAEINAMQGSWLDQMSVRVPSAIFMQSWFFLIETLWRVMGLMLLGMALIKSKMLAAEFSRKTYFGLGMGGILIGTFISGIGVFLNFENEWTLRFSLFLGRHFNYIGSLITAFGYIGIIMVISKSFHFDFLKNTLATLGRMAFSNYILQTLICTFIYYGFGFGKFAKSGRIAQDFVVVMIWLIITLFSLFWLKYFRFGPLEWAWRSLTYWKIQPFLKPAKPAKEGILSQYAAK